MSLVELFQYDFIINAFITGILLAAIIPCIGLVVTLKRLSMIGDAITHSSLAGVAAGLILGISPTLGAMAVCVAAALSIEALRKRLPDFSEISIVIVMSAGIGLAGILSPYVKTVGNFNSYLFGSIVLVGTGEFLLVAIVSVVVAAAFLLMYKELFCIAMDERTARLSGVRVSLVNSVFTLLTALTISVAARTVGALIISSLMIVPVACGLQLGRSYRQTLLISIAFAEAATVVGLLIANLTDWKPGAVIVLVSVLMLVLVLGFKKISAGKFVK